MESPRNSNHTRDDWEARKPLIQRLYLKENKTCKHIRKYLEIEEKFKVTERQIKNRLNEWGLESKKTCARHYQAMQAVLDHLEGHGLDIDFLVPKRGDRVVYSARKVKKECERIRKREMRMGCFRPCPVEIAHQILMEAQIVWSQSASSNSTSMASLVHAQISATTTPSSDQAASVVDTPDDDPLKPQSVTNTDLSDASPTTTVSDLMDDDISYIDPETPSEDGLRPQHGQELAPHASIRLPFRESLHLDVSLDVRSLFWLRNVWKHRRICHSSSLSTCNELPCLALSKSLETQFIFKQRTALTGYDRPNASSSTGGPHEFTSVNTAAGLKRGGIDLMFFPKLRCLCGARETREVVSSTAGQPNSHNRHLRLRLPRGSDADYSVEIEYSSRETSNAEQQHSDAQCEIKVDMGSMHARHWAAPFIRQCFVTPTDQTSLEVAKMQSVSILKDMLRQNDSPPILPDLSWAVMILGSNLRIDELKDLLRTCQETIETYSENEMDLSLGLLFKYALASVSSDVRLMDELSEDLPLFFAQCGLRWSGNHPNFLVASHFYAWDLIRLGDYGRAIPLLMACLPISIRMMGAHDTLTINCLVMLSRAYKETKEHFWALFFLREAMGALDDLRQQETRSPYLDCFCLSLLYRQGQLLCGIGDNDALAERQYWRVLWGRMAILGLKSGATWSVARRLRTIYKQTGRIQSSKYLKDYMDARWMWENSPDRDRLRRDGSDSASTVVTTSSAPA